MSGGFSIAVRRWRRARVVLSAVLAAMLAMSVMSGCRSTSAQGPLAGDDWVPPPMEGVATVEIPKAGLVAPPDEGVFIGIFRPPAPFNMDVMDSYKEITDKSPAILMWFQPWSDRGSNQFDTAAVVATFRRGAIPMITWEPWDPGVNPNLVREPGVQPDFELEHINNGRYDDYVRDWAQKIAAVGGPIMLRPMHEMNGEWYPWSGSSNNNSPEEFVEAWKRIHRIFEEEGATNVTWVWSVNRSSHPDVPENRPPAYYPGDEYVDWTSLSGFNWGDTRSFTKWEEFDQLYDEPLEYLKSLDKPIVISEFGSVETPGNKAEWIHNAYGQVRRLHPEIKAVVYYDKREKGLKGEQGWEIESTPESVEAFEEAVSYDHYVGAPAPALEQWAASLTTTHWSYLLTFRPIY